MPDRFRKELRDKPFTILDNAALRDPRLSLRARGLLVTCMSLPPDWSFSVRGLATLCKEGKDAVGTALNELEKAGYLRRNQLHGEGGAFGCTEYVFYEEAQPCPENPDTVKPDTAEPDTANPPEQKKEEQRKDIINPPKPPKGRRAYKEHSDYEPEIFDRFWTSYPIGRDKQGAIREWDRLKPNRQLMQTMAAALVEQKKTLSAEDPHDRYPFPYAIRWIRDRRWEDDLTKDTPRAPEARGTKAPAYEQEVSVWP